VLAALEVRFGSVPAGLAGRVREMRGRPELEALLRRAIVVERWLKRRMLVEGSLLGFG